MAYDTLALAILLLLKARTSLFFGTRSMRGALLWLLVETVAVAHAAEHPNVVLVTIDTLRADRLGCYGAAARGEGGSVTPNLDRLSRRGLLFTDATAQVPLTLPSHTSILTGLDPLT